MLLNVFRRTLGKGSFDIVLIFYILGFTLLEDDPADVLIYGVMEGITMFAMGLLLALIQVRSLGKFFLVLLVFGILLIPIAFCLLTPMLFVFALNDPEFGYFFSQKAKNLEIYLNNTNNFMSLLIFPYTVYGRSGLIFCAGVALSYLLKEYKDFRVFDDTYMPRVLPFSGIMAISFLICALPAFILGAIIPNSFPFFLIGFMRLTTEYCRGEDQIAGLDYGRTKSSPSTG